jgi:hypothetical protein
MPQQKRKRTSWCGFEREPAGLTILQRLALAQAAPALQPDRRMKSRRKRGAA